MPLVFQIGFLEVHWVDILDMFFVGLLLYSFYTLVRGTIAARVSIGFLSLYLIYLIVEASEMKLLSKILGQFMGVGMVALIIFFQTEIKKFLIILSQTATLNRWQALFVAARKRQNATAWDINGLIDATKRMSEANTGALIAIGSEIELNPYIETGDRMEAIISKSLILSIFFKNSPMHDGAAIITNGRLMAARCRLPISDNNTLPTHLGLRHRAALGLTEHTEASVLVVSEETGQIALARKGEIVMNLSSRELRTMLLEFLNSQEAKA
ncbi:MAG: TIGR00159 family protein [Cytophagales bacterium]|nr:MAG: TIGR00159 family protein [Cytophagales bacterium]TAF60612.1 MAG: TIGR00159 family protein [Cytophagales bacterium]